MKRNENCCSSMCYYIRLDNGCEVIEKHAVRFLMQSVVRNMFTLIHSLGDEPLVAREREVKNAVVVSHLEINVEAFLLCLSSSLLKLSLNNHKKFPQ